jgi:glycosyltransferase involved in cell wall biosynthesis
MRHNRRPLRVLFVLTSMPVGGAETLLVDLLRSFHPQRVVAEVCCLKSRGRLGEQIAEELPVHAEFIRHKHDWRVIGRLRRLMIQRQFDAVITVGAGDNMFWGRLAAYLARVPVIGCALHSTGWPDSIGRLNRWLTPLTDAFIAVAESHGKFLVERERLPSKRVFVIPNGVDTSKFRPIVADKATARRRHGLPEGVPLCCIVAALRPEKNHRRFLRIAALTRQEHAPQAEFIIVGDGPGRAELKDYSKALKIDHAVHFLGSRSDVETLLPACDVFMLTSDNEASPVSIMEAMACGLPVIAPDVGSVSEVVKHEMTGFIIAKTDEREFVHRLGRLLSNLPQAAAMGDAGHQRIRQVGALDRMVRGYERLIESQVAKKLATQRALRVAKRSRRRFPGPA